MMRKTLISAAVVAVLAFFHTASARAGLTVTLEVEGNNVALIPLFPGSGTPDNNNQFQNGFVSVLGLGLDVDGVGGFDLFIDSLSVYSNKTASEGKVTTINIAARLLGSAPVSVVINAFDLFGVPETQPGAPLEITSTFLDVNDGLSTDITLNSYLDNLLVSSATVDSQSDIGTQDASESATGNTVNAPFQLGSQFAFELGPNSTVSFRAETVASPASVPPDGGVAHLPEAATFIGWASLLALSGLVYGWKRRRSA